MDTSDYSIYVSSRVYNTAYLCTKVSVKQATSVEMTTKQTTSYTSVSNIRYIPGMVYIHAINHMHFRLIHLFTVDANADIWLRLFWGDSMVFIGINFDLSYPHTVELWHKKDTINN